MPARCGASIRAISLDTHTSSPNPFKSVFALAARARDETVQVKDIYFTYGRWGQRREWIESECAKEMEPCAC